jgi:hypothetical protein
MVRVSGDDLLRAAAAELYSADPDQFVERRGVLAARARTDGQAAAAKQITGMRKPTRSAWIINQLVRAEPGVIAQLADLGRKLRAAQRTLDGAAIRELSQQRRELVGTLVRQAFTVAGQQAPPAALRDEVAATFGAALNDPQVANQLAEGTLVRAARSEGFGSTGPELTLVPSAGGSGPAGPGSRPGPGGRSGTGSAAGPQRPSGPAARGSRSAAAGSTSGPADRDRQPATTRRSGKSGLAAVSPAQPAPAEDAGPAAARDRKASGAARAKPAELAAARKKAEQQQRREAVAAAERALAAADRAVEAASRAEQEQEAAVLRLEEQLADARQQLADVRLRARRARTGQRQARQAADRLHR